ncbi:hypothetical protein Tsubulata_026452 [Turnera subulata]|uniref:Uncharacterized protein n=1 Tax=Turnera subulata TaxID=218843 RepID=A0A9Q0FXF1_9ROSI|nr:hypothetical protein Tsubulata_026452 [Turnera subulata]
MAIPEAMIKANEHTSFPENGVLRPSCSLKCMIIGDICLSHALGPCDPDVKCAGYRGQTDPVCTFHDSGSGNNEGDQILDSSSVKKCVLREKNTDVLAESDKQESAKGGGSLAGKWYWLKFDEGLSTRKQGIKGEESRNFHGPLCCGHVCGALQNPRPCYQTWRIKDNKPFIWRKRSSNEKVVETSLPESNFSGKPDSLRGQCLLPNPWVSSSEQKGDKVTENGGPRVHARFHSRLFVHSDHQAHWIRCNGSCPRCFSGLHQMGGLKAEAGEMVRFHDSFGCQQNSIGQGGQEVRTNNCFQSHNQFAYTRPALPWFHSQPYHYSNINAAQRTIQRFQSAHLQSKMMRFIPGQSGFHRYGGVKGFRINHDMDCEFRPFHTSVDRRQCSGIELYNGATTCGRKEIRRPIGTKDSGLLHEAYSPSVCDSPHVSQASCNYFTTNDLKVNDVPLSVTTVKNDSDHSIMISSPRCASVHCEASKSGIVEAMKAESSKDDIGCGEKHRGTSPFTGFEVVEALNAAHKLQLVSQSIQLTLGHPLAEIERFLHSAAPVINTSNEYEMRSVLLDNHLPNGSLFKHQIPRISLSSVWNWFEESGNYGLEVKAEDFRYCKDSNARSVPFQAYFVPSLSAVQLFSFPLLSDPCGEYKKNANTEMTNKSQSSGDTSARTMSLGDDTVAAENLWSKGTKFALKFDPAEESVLLSKVQLNGEDGFSFISSSTGRSDSELIFEFFETEKPHQRKPLHLKILELINAGTSNPQVYGDPSKLESGNLQNMHPASWFSVAWYPIYRIPEGKLQASFLTYHSFGQFVGKCIPNDSLNKMAFHIVFPVIGLESCNAKGECWFDLRLPVDSASKASICNSEIFKERLRTLQENASLLSRAFVNKDKANVANRHPDYEFFISRNH